MNKEFFEKNIKKLIIAGIVAILSITGIISNDVIDNNNDSNINNNQNSASYNESNVDYNSDDKTINKENTNKNIVDEPNNTTDKDNNKDNNKDTDKDSDKKNNKNNDSEIEIVYEFRKDKYLNEHFEKHGDEFSYQTADEYEEGANRVIMSDDALHKVEKEDGDDIYYIEDTNEFVVVSTDGYIRTYFKPSDGLDYYNRQ